MNIEYLIEKYANLIYKICFNMLPSPQEAEDMCQETYLSLYINLEKYKALSESEYKNLICKIALNKCRDYLRIKQRKKEENLDDNIIDFKEYSNLENTYLKNEESENLKNAIYSLREPYKTIIYDYYINELSLDKLALQMNTTKGTIKTQLHRGKEFLKEKIEKVRR